VGTKHFGVVGLPYKTVLGLGILFC